MASVKLTLETRKSIVETNVIIIKIFLYKLMLQDRGQYIFESLSFIYCIFRVAFECNLFHS